MRQDWRFIGSKTEFFLLYAVVGLVTAIVSVAIDELMVALLFLGICVLAALSAWRSWTRRDY